MSLVNESFGLQCLSVTGCPEDLLADSSVMCIVSKRPPTVTMHQSLKGLRDVAGAGSKGS